MSLSVFDVTALISFSSSLRHFTWASDQVLCRLRCLSSPFDHSSFHRGPPAAITPCIRQDNRFFCRMGLGWRVQRERWLPPPCRCERARLWGALTNGSLPLRAWLQSQVGLRLNEDSSFPNFCPFGLSAVVDGRPSVML